MAESGRARRQRLGPYELVSELGRGAMGVVYRARDLRDGAARAVKTLDATLADAELLARFQREAEALGALPAHPNLVPLREAGVEAGICWFAMDLFEGGSLRDRLRAGSLELRQAVAWTRDVARGLAALHAHGLVHRDVKPGNVLIDDGGAARLADLGLVRSLDDHTRLTRTGTLLGTPVYMPPETLVGEPWGPAGDVYSLGQVLFQLVSGHTAVPAGAAVQVFAAITAGSLRPLRELVPGLPPALEELYERTRLRDPARRPGAEEVAEALDAWLHSAGRGVRPRGLRLAGTAAACSLLALGALLIARRPAEPPGAPVAPAPSPSLSASLDPAERACERAAAALDAAEARIASDAPAAALACAEVCRDLLPTAGPRADALRARARSGARWGLLRARGGRVLRMTVAGEETKVQALAFAPDGRTLFVASEEGFQARSVPAGLRLESPLARSVPVEGCLVDPQGRWIALVEGRRVSRWSLGAAGEVGPALPPLELEADVEACAASPQGALAAIDSGAVVLCDPSGAQRRTRLGNPRVDKKWAAFDPSGRVLAVAGDQGVWVWDTTQRRPERIATEDDHNLVAFARDGRMLLIEQVLYRWALDLARGTWEEDGEADWGTETDAESCALQGDLLVTGMQSSSSEEPPGLFLVWDLSGGRLAFREPHPWHRDGAGLTETVRACAFAPGTPLLACGDDHGAVCLFWLGEAPPPEPLLPDLDERAWTADPPAELRRLLAEPP